MPAPGDESVEPTTALAIAPSGVRKSAILLLSLEPQQAKQILSRLPADAVRAVQREMASLECIGASERDQIVQEYRQKLGQPAAPPKDELFPLALNSVPGLSSEFLYESLSNEHPQTIAAVLASFTISKAGACLSRMPIRTQIEVIRRLASMRTVDAEVLEAVYAIIRSRPAHHSSYLSAPARVFQDEPLADSCGDPDFEALSRLDDNAMRHVLEEVDSDGLALAISTVSRVLRRRVLDVLPKSTRAQVKRAARARPLYLSDIESAQARILRIVRRLEAAGELSVGLCAPKREGE